MANCVDKFGVSVTLSILLRAVMEVSWDSRMALV